MQTRGLQAPNTAARQAFSAKWNTLVNQKLRPRVMARRAGASGGSNASVLASPLSGSAFQLPSSFILPNLWVDNGAIWQLPNMLLGFTNYSAATSFLSSVSSLGLYPAPQSWYAGTPFSATDFPILWEKEQSLFLLWSSINALSYAQKFLPMVPDISLGLGFYVTMPPAGPVVPVSSLQSFSSNSSSGMQTFSAQYILYCPWGTQAGGENNSVPYTGIVNELYNYYWLTRGSL